MTDEIVIKQLKVLIDFGKVNELQGIVDVAENAIDAIERLTADRDRLQKDFNELDMENLAMLRDLREAMDCANCKYVGSKAGFDCKLDGDRCEYEWRGVCEENSGGMNDGE